MIKYLFSLVILLGPLIAFADTDASCSARPSEVIQVLHKGITLNEKFKKTVGGGDTSEYQRLRKDSEKYDETTVMPCVRRAAQLLTKSSNSALMHKLMELVISYENSADETVSYSMGKIFAGNPAVIEHSIKKFPAVGRRLILNSVQTGWVNVGPGLPPAVVKSRNERIKHLRSSIDSP